MISEKEKKIAIGRTLMALAFNIKYNYLIPKVMKYKEIIADSDVELSGWITQFLNENTTIAEKINIDLIEQHQIIDEFANFAFKKYPERNIASHIRHFENWYKYKHKINELPPKKENLKQDIRGLAISLDKGKLTITDNIDGFYFQYNSYVDNCSIGLLLTITEILNILKIIRNSDLAYFFEYVDYKLKND